MAGPLQYALQLQTDKFDNPLRESDSKLQKFDASATKGASKLAGFAAAAAGAAAAVGLFAAVTGAALANLESYAEFDGLVRGLKTLEGTAEATTARITLLRDVAKVPGLGFEEAVRGDIRLRAVGVSAALSEKIMRSFGNAIATVGGGAADLDGVILALGQIESKGKISTEEINQLAERVPQVRAAIKDAFGTSDIEALAKSTLTTTEFIEGMVSSLEKLPQVTGGARNILDNYNDSWKELKNSASEFAVGISGSWINAVSGAFNQASRDLQKLKNLFGIETPGLTGPDGPTDAQRTAEKEAEAKLEAERQAYNESVRLANDNAEFAQRLSEERAAFLKAQAAEQIETEKRTADEIKKAQEKVFAARLSDEANLIRQIAELRRNGPTTAEEVNALPANSAAQLRAAESLAQLVSLEKELKDLRESATRETEAQAKAAASKAETAAKELTAQQQASAFFQAENEILSARVAGNDKLEKSLQRQLAVEQLKLQLMRDQGLSETAAADAAARRISLEERANGTRRRGLLDAAASAAARLERRSAADVARGNGLGNTDRLAIADLERRQRNQRPNTLAENAAELARRNPAADPGRPRREEREERRQANTDPLLREVREIKDKFENIARA